MNTVEYVRSDKYFEGDPSVGRLVLEEEGYQVLRNEFAEVAVCLDESANGPRLKIVDLRSGSIGYLEPFELWAVAVRPPGELAEMLDVLIAPH